MADKKITQLTALGAAPDTADILAIVDDPGGTPVTKKVTVANLLAALDKSAGNLDDFDFDDNPILGFSSTKSDRTSSTTFALTNDYNGKVIVYNNASDITINVNTGLATGFGCAFVQKGAGQVILAGTGTVNHRLSHDRTAGQYSVMCLTNYDTDVYALSGDTNK